MLYCLSTAHVQRAADVPVTITQELAQLRMEHANILGQHRSLTDVLARREAELKRAEELLVAEQNQTSTLKFRLQSTEAASLRAEKRAKTAQQEADMVNALLVRRLSYDSNSPLNGANRKSLPRGKKMAMKRHLQM
jgi:sirohydrochlorin ferrochelatase